jgi:transcriptional regulator with XRE-family HTH domain
MTEQGFAARLKRLREEAGLSQAELAAAAGMNRFGVAKLEQGQRSPAWETVLALARALGVSCEAFVGEANEGAGAAGKPPGAARAGRSHQGATREPSGEKKPAAERPGGRKGKGTRGKGES